MDDVIQHVVDEIENSNLYFLSKPILIGGMAMEYYGMRKSGADIDLIITNKNYQRSAGQFPDKTKDLYGDLGIVMGKFEIWRSIAHLDYDFFKKEAIETEKIYVISIDRLLWSRVCAMDIEKYRTDLKLIREYYYKNYTNETYHKEALSHEKSYAKNRGVILGGRYID